MLLNDETKTIDELDDGGGVYYYDYCYFSSLIGYNIICTSVEYER
jgi:hypothetical protein